MTTSDDTVCTRMQILSRLDGRALLSSALAIEIAAVMVMCQEGECYQRKECLALASKGLCADPE